MTLHITLDRGLGTEIVCEDDDEPLGFIVGLELGTDVRRAWVANAPRSQEVVDRTRKTLMRHGFDVGVAT